tara:strand:- start:64 stop:303 length:240 start_codon:yes stop_codon:yes gene_type:complete
MVVVEVRPAVLKVDIILLSHLLVLVVLVVVVMVVEQALEMKVLQVFNTLEEVVVEDTDHQKTPRVVAVEMVSLLSDINN